jgi:uncharacterized protein (DUF849 family)
LKTTKTIITCAITGAATKPEQTPYLPVTPEQIAQSALEAAEAGATIAHIHVRDIFTGKPSMDIKLYSEVFELIKKSNSKLIINLTTGPGATFVPHIETLANNAQMPRLLSAAERVKHIEILKPDICSLDFNTMNLDSAAVRINHPQIIKEMLSRIQAVGTKPELEIFDSGDLRIALEMLSHGAIQKPALWQFAMGIKYGWDATPATLQYAYNHLPVNSNWSAFGIGQTEMPMVALSAIYGGHVRVGMEDNIYLKRGQLATTNAELVQKAKRIVEDLGYEIANTDEARLLLGLKPA